MSLAPDPADKSLDAAADGAFGGKQPVGTDCNPNRRAGYGDQLAMILRVARKGGTLAAGEGLKIIEHYESLVRNAYREGWYKEASARFGFWHYTPEGVARTEQDEAESWADSDAYREMMR